MELSARYARGLLSAYANYTYLDSKDEEGKRSDEVAMHSANIGANYKIDSHLRLDVRSNFVGAKNNPTYIMTTADNRVEPHTVFKAALNYQNFYGADLQLSVSNLFDSEYYHTSNRPVTRYRQPQRAVMLRVEYGF